LLGLANPNSACPQAVEFFKLSAIKRAQSFLMSKNVTMISLKNAKKTRDHQLMPQLREWHFKVNKIKMYNLIDIGHI